MISHGAETNVFIRNVNAIWQINCQKKVCFQSLYLKEPRCVHYMRMKNRNIIGDNLEISIDENAICDILKEE